MSVSDYVENVMEVPIHKALKNQIEIYYKIYKDEPNVFINNYYNAIPRGRHHSTLVLILPFLFKFYNDIVDRS